MRRICSLILLFGYAMGAATAQVPAPKRPKLILTVVVDQFRYEYLSRFRDDYTAGFKRILEQGASFENAHYIHAIGVTAVGHATVSSGATPALSGIIGNEWYDRESKQNVTSVSDPSTKLLGGTPGIAGSSPRRLLVSTIGDEIRMRDGKSKVIGISIKDRSAILPAGHMADAAYWFEDKSNHWVSSDYYMKELPRWVQEVNDSKPYLRAVGAVWMAVTSKPGDKPLCTMVKGVEGTRFCGSLDATPWGNEMIEEMAEKALAAEGMGTHEATDVLTVSFSANDYVGHAVGPDAPEVRDISIRTDRLLGKLLAAVDKQVGLGNVMFVLTADHGVAPVPEVNAARNMPGGRIASDKLSGSMQKALETKFGPGKWLVNNAPATPYFSRDLIQKYKLTEAEVENAAAEVVRTLPNVFRVYTAEELRTGRVPADLVGTAAVNGYYEGRSSDLLILLESYWLNGGERGGTTHGTPFNYDTHVPMIFMGAGIKPGHYYQTVSPNDIAPTLAAIAGVQEPSGSVGRVLYEMWQ